MVNSTSPNLQSSIKKPRRRFQLGIRTLLLLTLVLALCIYGYTKVLKREQAIQLLTQHGYKIEFCEWDEVPLRYRLLSLIVGENGGLPVKSFTGGAEFELSEGPQIEAIAELSEMTELSLEYMTRTNFDLTPLHSLVNVQKFLSWDACSIDDSGIFGSMPKLRTFKMIEGTFDGDMAEFGRLKELKEVTIQLSWLKMTDLSFDKFCNATALEKLDLSHNYRREITDFSPLLKLKKLKELKGVLDPENPDHQDLIDALPKGCDVEYE